MTVRMTHPASGGSYDAQPSQVEHLKASGWEPADPDADYERWPEELQRFEGQEQVRLRHPDLTAEITVARSAVPEHRSVGWYQVEEDVSLPSPAGEGEPPDDLDSLTVPELQDLLRARDLPVSGTKPELIERLRTTPATEAPAEPAEESEA